MVQRSKAVRHREGTDTKKAHFLKKRQRKKYISASIVNKHIKGILTP